MVDATNETDDKRKRTRSPAYPYMNLESAIKRAKEFYDEEGRNAANIKVAVKHWGYEEKSSSGMQAVAALISFGLLRDEGAGDKRKVQLTSNALRILLDTDPGSKARTDAIKAAALSPKIHQELWKKWGSTHPSDLSMKNVLTLEWEPPFNDKAVDVFIKEYKDTIAFAKLSDSDTLSKEVIDKEGDGNGESERRAYCPAVGDYVQWEHNGVLGLPEPRRVREIAPDGLHAFLDGQYGAVPISELIKESAPAASTAPDSTQVIQAARIPPKTHIQEFVVPLSDGARAIFQWPASLTREDVDDLKDSLKILERKITRSTKATEDAVN